MTARHDATPEPADHMKAARPDHGQADRGTTGGRANDGKPGTTQFGAGGAGDNAQRGSPSGTESERHAPGMSTEKKADDTK